MLTSNRVDENLVFKNDLAGAEKLKESKKSSKKFTMDVAVTATSASEGSSTLRGKKKRAQEESLESKQRKKRLLQTDMFDEEENNTSVLKLQIPLTLKKHLVDEWKIVTKPPFRMLSLPRSFTVTDVISEFLLYKQGKVDEIMVGMSHRQTSNLVIVNILWELFNFFLCVDSLI